MDNVRSYIRESADTHHNKELGVSMLWGILETHAVMQEYIHYTIQYHSLISAEYVTYLVINRASIGHSGDTESEDVMNKM